MMRDQLADGSNVRNIRIEVRRERRRNADHDRIAPDQAGKIGRRDETAGVDDFGQLAIVDVANVVEAVVDLIDANRIAIVSDDLKSDFRLLNGERQSDVADAGNADDRRTIEEFSS